MQRAADGQLRHAFPACRGKDAIPEGQVKLQAPVGDPDADCPVLQEVQFGFKQGSGEYPVERDQAPSPPDTHRGGGVDD